jgi:exopolyphosphatase / guanosine-5'-triphosphate,3'-diphosphate pyrophosphatase
MRRLAAIDIGTVTTRLLVADVGPDGIVEVDRSTDITHLGERLTETGALSREAMERVAEIVAVYSQRMSELGVEHHVAMATSASRDASNGSDFLDMLASEGVEPMIITGSREAELAFRGATAQRQGERMLVVDCGGGSTELVLGDVLDGEGGREVRIHAARSIDVGSKRMTERFLRSDPPTDGELEAARGWALGELGTFFSQLSEKPAEMIALAGTATTLVAIQMGLARYDSQLVHGSTLTFAELRELLGRLAAMPLERRLQVVGLHPGRAGVIVAGALIFETVMELAELEAMIVSEHDILYGILLDAYDDLQEA